MKFTLVLGLTVCLMTPSFLLAQEVSAATYAPHDHPAMVDRELTAFTRPFRHVEIAAEDTARLLALEPAEGTRIEGDPGTFVPIGFLSDTSAKLRLAQAQAAVIQAQAAVAEAKDRLGLAIRDEAYQVGEQARIVGLHEKGSASSKQRDDAVFAGEMAQLRKSQAQTAVTMAEAAVSSAQAEEQFAAHVVARHQLTAPTGWLVAERHVEPGALVNPGQPIMTLLDVERLLVPLRLSEPALAALREQKTISLTFLDGRSAEATLHRIDPRHDPVSRKRLCELVINAADAPEASGGLEVSINLQMRDPAGSVLIPRHLLAPRFERWVVRFADGTESSVVPLREVGDAVAVAKREIPEGALLVPHPMADTAEDSPNP